MSTLQIDTRGLQSKTDDSVLEALKQNLYHLKAAFETEKVAFEVARARFVRAEEALASAQARFDGFATIVSEQRSKIRRVPDLETEILCSIFEAACPPHSIDPWSLSETTPLNSVKQRSMTPFCLSAVCKRWRTVATTSGSLWNLITIPNDRDDTARASRTIDYITAVAQRSKAFDLAVIVGWKTVKDFDKDGCTRTIAALVPHLQRIASFEIHVGLSGSWMNLLRRPTPRLKTLYCMVSQPNDGWDDAPLPRYLPIAPELEVIRLIHCPLIPQGPLPSLQRLAVKLASVPSKVIIPLFVNAPVLSNVHLTIASVTAVDTPATSRQIAVPSLTALHLSSSAASVLFQPNISWQFPRVTYMTLDIVQIDTAHQVLAAVHATLTGMTLDGPGFIRETLTDVLRPLAKLKTLLLRSCNVTDGFWRALCQTDEIILPALATVTLDSVHLAEDVEGDAVRGDGLVQFVRERRRGGSTVVAGGSQLKTVRSVTIKPQGTLDAWLVDEINYIMNNST